MIIINVEPETKTPTPHEVVVDPSPAGADADEKAEHARRASDRLRRPQNDDIRFRVRYEIEGFVRQ